MKRLHGGVYCTMGLQQSYWSVQLDFGLALTYKKERIAWKFRQKI